MDGIVKPLSSSDTNPNACNCSFILLNFKVILNRVKDSNSKIWKKKNCITIGKIVHIWFTANSNGGRTLADPSVKFLSFSCSFWGNFGQIIICGPQSWINHYITFVFISFTFSVIKNLKNLKILEIVLYTASKFTDLQKNIFNKVRLYWSSRVHSFWVLLDTQETEGQVICINNNAMTVWLLLTKQNHFRKSKFYVVVNQPISQCYHVCVHA